MDRACKALENSDSFKKMYNSVAGCIDACLNREVSRQLLEDFPLDTKSDLILTQAQDGAISLLRKWPDMKYKLHVYLNHQLPSNLRLVAWRLFLENTKIRKEYTDILSTNPRYAISPQDLEISRTCEQLLIHESSFNELKGYVGAFYAMKAVLSYHHARMKTEKKLPSADFMLVIPFVQVSLPNISKREPATSSVAALLVEEYLTFMESRPNFMMHAAQKQSQEGLAAVAVKVGKHLKKEANELVEPIVMTSYENKEKILESDKGQEEAFKKALMELIHPLLRTLFVGYLRMDTLLFCWDQVIIGRDVAEWMSEIVPALIAVFFHILRKQLKNKSTVEEWHKSLKEEGQKLTASQFQYEINRYFIEDLRKILNQEDRAAMPVLDPTYTPYPAWKHWHDDPVPPRIGPVQRRTNRNARQLEREKEAKEKELIEERKRRILEEEKLKEEERFNRELARDRRREEEARIKLEDELEEEKKRRRYIEDELNKLRNELDNSKAARKKVTRNFS
ncbi:DgyrCDS9617 [Dimorphilus gyrociliatus]|uniref:DgyrCDS9617 n=1 Tax=Dimorphilus gyrociliatus TaxID=2664684 RepID=A0A7I8VZQ0_9ANNE|nr:DgyrCDS9617 [Dimorphilus gyrociliatus]